MSDLVVSSPWVSSSQIPGSVLSWSPSLLPGSWNSFFFLGLWRDRLLFRSDFPEQSCGSSMVWSFSRCHWEHWSAPSFAPQSSHSAPEPNPALLGPSLLPGPSLGLSDFWKCQLSGFPQGQEIKSGSLSAKQPVRLPGFLFFLLAFASISVRLKSQGAEK